MPFLLCRSMIKNPSILLLDEATSALDHQTEKHVQSALDEVGKDRTTIVIAHRLSTIKKADRIVFIKDGAVMEIGSHDELVAKRGFYYGLLTAHGTHALDESSVDAELAATEVGCCVCMAACLHFCNSTPRSPTQRRCWRRRRRKSRRLCTRSSCRRLCKQLIFVRAFDNQPQSTQMGF